MKIYVVRHGQSTHNANQDTPHNPDPPLTALGREQAQITAAALRVAQLEAVALYAGPQRRALETAAAIQKALHLAPHILPDLCEAGGLQEHAGMCREDILREWPGMTLDERITATGWWTGGTGEDKEEALFYDRAARALSLLRQRHSDREETIIVVTHGRFGSGLLSTMLGLGPAGYHRYPLDNCAISRVDYDLHDRVGYAPPPSEMAAVSPYAVRLRFHNRTDHLPLSHQT